MNANSARLAQRRERLILLAAAQRTALAESIAPWRVPLTRIDQGLAALRVIKRNPALVVGAVALFAALRPLRVMKWLRRGWIAWQMLSGLRKK